MAKKYVVNLSDEERQRLHQLLRKGKASARRLTRARILLLADENRLDHDVAEMLHIGISTVERTRRKCVEGGVEFALGERPRPGGQRKLDGKGEAMLVALACSDPPDGRTAWTMQLLADRLVALEIVESISDETVRRVLKKVTSNPGSKRNGVSPR